MILPKMVFPNNIVSFDQFHVLWFITPHVFPSADCDLKPMQL